MSEHGTLLEEMLARVEGGQDVLDEMERERGSRPPETEAAKKIRDENVLMYLEREGTIKRGSGQLPANFWDLPRPDDPDNSVRRALEEDRR
jgi:hypothetical protein